MSSSTATTTTSNTSGSSAHSTSSRKKRRKKRRGSGSSNASIISIDQVSLNRLRKSYDRATRAKRKEKEEYKQQKQKRMENLSKKLQYASELKEDQTDDEGHFGSSGVFYSEASDKRRAFEQYTNYQPPATSTMENITEDELLLMLRPMVDHHQELLAVQENMAQELAEYECTQKELRMVLEDEITAMRQRYANILPASAFSASNVADQDDTKMLLHALLRLQKEVCHGMGAQFEDDRQALRRQWEANLMDAQYQNSLDSEDTASLRQKAQEMEKELDAVYKENDGLRQSVEKLQHQNQGLRQSMNNGHKQLQSMAMLRKTNKRLQLDHEALQRQIGEMQLEMARMAEENENLILNQDAAAHRVAAADSGADADSAADRLPPTPMVGVGGILSDRSASTVDHTDLMHQIGDEYEAERGVSPQSTRHSSDPPDRDSNYGDEVDEVKHNENEDALEALGRFKNVSGEHPNWEQIGLLLKKKEIKRLQANSQPHSQDVFDTLSLESNYSESAQNIGAQLDGIEDDVRELKELVIDLQRSTNHITPTVAHSLHPLARKIQRIYLMLSGPMPPEQSTTSALNEAATMATARRVHHRHRRSMRSGGMSPYDSDTDDTSSQPSTRPKSMRSATGYWVGYITPWIADWMPSIGFSAILLSTMYLMFQRQRASPKVLRNGRH